MKLWLVCFFVLFYGTCDCPYIRELALKDEVVKIHPVQKMTSAGQRNRFVCYALVGDGNGHIGLGNKVGNRMPNDIKCFNNKSKNYLLLNIVPVKNYDKYNIIIKNRQKLVLNNLKFKGNFISKNDFKCSNLITKIFNALCITSYSSN